jgi:hypothetical protein
MLTQFLRTGHKNDNVLFSWSYGVLLYEIFTSGETPYFSVQQVDMLQHLEDGNRLPQPQLANFEMLVAPLF